MKNIKSLLIAFVVGAIAYHFAKPFLIKKAESNIDEALNSELNDPETIKDINE